MTEDADLFIIPTRQKADLLAPALSVLLQEAGATLTLPIVEVDGYQMVAFLLISDQPVTLVVQEAVQPGGPFIQTSSTASSLDAASGLQKVVLKVSPVGAFMKILVTNTGTEAQKVFQLDVRGYGSAGTSSSGSGGGSTFILFSADASLPNSRVLTAGANITIVDGGPGGTLTISSTGGGGSLEQARAVGDTFTGGSVFWDGQNAGVFGKASGEANQDYLQIYSDKVGNLQVIDSTKDGAGTIRPISFQFGGVEMVQIAVNGDVHIVGKLTVDGAIDPPSVSLSGGTALFFDSDNGATAPVSAAGHGRLRYNNPTLSWQMSVNGGAYTDIAAGAANAWVDGGNSFGGNASIGLNDNFTISIKQNNIVAGVIDASKRLLWGSNQTPRVTSSDISIQIRQAAASAIDASLLVQTDTETKESLVGVCTAAIDGGNIAVSGSSYPGTLGSTGVALAGNFRMWGGDQITGMVVGCRADVQLAFASNSSVVAKFVNGSTGHFLVAGPTRIGSLTDSFVANEFLRVSTGPLHVDGFIGVGSGLTVDPAYALHVRRDVDDGASSILLDNRNTGASAVVYIRMGNDPLGGGADSMDVYSYSNAHRAGINATPTITELRINPTGGALTLYGANTKRIECNGTGIGFFTATPVGQQTVGAVTNNVTAGGTDGTIANYTDLIIYANDAAEIRNDIYQLARSVAQLATAVRNLGLAA